MTTYRGVAIVYCDNHVLVAVKPPNLPAQADASGDLDMLTLMKEFVKESFQKPSAVYLGLLHRLDRPVGGLMAFARTSKAASRLSAQLRLHQMQRTYLAVVRGDAAAEARLSGLLPRDDGAPQEASLLYRCLEREGSLCLLAISLETGRKHQIRRQLASAGLPIWGDARYGGGRPGEQIALFGASLAFAHPTTQEQMIFHASPADIYPWTMFKPFERESL